MSILTPFPLFITSSVITSNPSLLLLCTKAQLESDSKIAKGNKDFMSGSVLCCYTEELDPMDREF